MNQNIDKRKNKHYEKALEDRNSLLTDLFKSKNFQSIRNYFYALLIVYVVTEVITYTTTKPTTFGLGPLVVGFDKFLLGVVLWLLLFTLNVLVVVLFKFWARIRTEISPIFTVKKPWDILALLSLITYYICCLYYVPVFTNRIKSGCLTALVIHLENVRLIMQTHSFVRSNTPKVLKHKQHSDEVLELPSIQSYIYFSFAPTLIYKNAYPRRDKINKAFLFQCFFDMCLAIWMLSFIYEKFFSHAHRDAGLVKMDWTDFAIKVFNNFPCSMLVFLTVFYIMLHCWCNGMAEILRFADREYYSDFWTATDYGSFYRKWNYPIQNWLYVYIYKEFKENITPNNASFSKFMVLIISTVVHEYVMFSIFNTFFPAMFILMLFITTPSAFLRTDKPIANLALVTGFGLMISFLIHIYSMEYNAVKNCPVQEDGTLLQYLPRTLTANCY